MTDYLVPAEDRYASLRTEIIEMLEFGNRQHQIGADMRRIQRCSEVDKLHAYRRFASDYTIYMISVTVECLQKNGLGTVDGDITEAQVHAVSGVYGAFEGHVDGKYSDMRAVSEYAVMHTEDASLIHAAIERGISNLGKIKELVSELKLADSVFRDGVL